MTIESSETMNNGPVNPTGIAFFDLDRTILSINSATAWIRRERRMGHISVWQAFKAAIWILFYYLGLVQKDHALRDAVKALCEVPEDGIANRTHDFWFEEVQKTIRPGARAAIDAHRKEGHAVVMLTSSSNYMSALVLKALPLDDSLCNHLEVENGRFTGRLREPICFGEGKVIHAQQYANKCGIPLSDCWFYTDSYSDLPVLERVGTPIAVDPDPRLARIARKLGWQIADWD